MTEKDKEELLNAYGVFMEMHLDMFSRAMKHTDGDTGLSLQLAAGFTYAITHEQTHNKAFQFLCELGREDE